MKQLSSQAILVINPGGTSTKIAVFSNEEIQFSENIHHTPTELNQFKNSYDQLSWRQKQIQGTLDIQGIDVSKFKAVVGRGGPLLPMPSGTYVVDDIMLARIETGNVMVQHPSLLGAPLASAFAKQAKCPSYIVDPVCVDEMIPEAKITGIPNIRRQALSHALNVKAASRKAANILGRPLEDLNMIVAHLGSGFTIAAQQKGRQIDHNDATASGPMAPTRAGSLPALDFAKLCFSGTVSKQDVEGLLVKYGGWLAHLGTADIRDIYTKIDAGDLHATEILKATVHQIIKEIGGLWAVLHGDVDALVITGGVAQSKRFVDTLKIELAWLPPPVIVIPGENEMLALAQGALRVLTGEITARSIKELLSQ